MPGSPTWVSGSSTSCVDLLQYQKVWEYDKQKPIKAGYRSKLDG